MKNVVWKFSVDESSFILLQVPTFPQSQSPKAYEYYNTETTLSSGRGGGGGPTDEGLVSSYVSDIRNYIRVSVQ